MVDRTDGQFYTMEGIAAAVLMVLTAYLVLSGTTLYTPGDTHIIDMQLEQVGYDALKIMDTKNNDTDTFSHLELYVRNMTTTGGGEFASEFKSIIDTSSVVPDNIHFQADIYYRLSNDTINTYHFIESGQIFSGNENAVRVTRWVFIDKQAAQALKNSGNPPNFRNNNQTVLLEVMLWRG